MREQYKALELEVIRFETEDVITTSCQIYDPGCTEYGGGGGDD